MPLAPTEIRSLARKHTHLAIRTLRHVAAQHDAPPAARVAAANALLDRGWGKPEQHVEVSARIADQMSDAELNSELARLSQLLGIGFQTEPELLEPPIDLQAIEIDPANSSKADS